MAVVLPTIGPTAACCLLLRLRLLLLLLHVRQ
jgi:hypothetical protein